MIVASHLIMLLACVPKPNATTGPIPSSGKPLSSVAPTTTSTTITSTGVGRFQLGVNVESPPFEGSHYWWDGYFATHTLRALYSPKDKLSIFTSPKQRIHKLLVGAQYSTLKGAKIGMTAKDLKAAYPDLKPSTEKMEKSFIYRPDHIEGENDMMFNWSYEQPNRRDLACALTSASLSNVDFFFENCDASGFPGDNTTIEAVMITDPDKRDMQHEDPILDLASPLPCPKPRTDEPERLAKEGDIEINKGKMGDYHAISAVWKGLPMLRNAAISGSLTAIDGYVSMLNTCVHQEYMGDPLNRPMEQGSQEALLFTLIYDLRKGTQKGSCAEMLLKAEGPLSKEMFYSDDENAEETGGPCINDYRFSILTPSEIEGVIAQAKAWQHCWD